MPVESAVVGSSVVEVGCEVDDAVEGSVVGSEAVPVDPVDPVASVSAGASSGLKHADVTIRQANNETRQDTLYRTDARRPGQSPG